MSKQYTAEAIFEFGGVNFSAALAMTIPGGGSVVVAVQDGAGWAPVQTFTTSQAVILESGGGVIRITPSAGASFTL